MKRFASFFMILVLTMSFTWSRATIPDTKENSKTEIPVADLSVKMAKTDLNFSSQKEFLFVHQNYSDLDDVLTAEINEINFPAKTIQKSSKNFTGKTNLTGRNPRDGLSWQNLQVRY